MKKITFATIFVTAFFGVTSMAQTGQWKLAGNSLAGTEKLGSTNNQDVRFISNNVVNGVLTKSGLWGIGTSAPLSKLHVKNGSSGISPFFQSALTTESSDNAYINILSPSAHETGILFGNNSSNVSGGIIYNSSFKNTPVNALQFRTGGNDPKMVLTAAGNLGIGTTTPKASLHIFRGSAGGVAPNIESPIVAEANGNSFINLLAPVANVSGILFGNNTNAVDGGIVYGGLAHTMDFRTKGNISRMTLTSNGNLGIGTTDPEDFRVKIIDGPFVGGFASGLALENTDTPGVPWEFFAGGTGLLTLLFDGGLKGQFNPSTGAYNTLSDARFKTNIQPMPGVLGKISQLKPSTYRFKNAADAQDHNGFIAQDVMKVFPSLVSHTIIKERNVDVYAMDYSGFGTIAIKGIQELMKINDSLKSEIQNMKSEMSEIKAMLKGNQGITSSQSKINTSLTDASLEQNTPNPFTNSTTIHYALPQKFANAQIIITDKSGKTMKRVNISGTGKGIVHVDASALSSGAYSYSLIVDGKLIGTKQMVLTK